MKSLRLPVYMQGGHLKYNSLYVTANGSYLLKAVLRIGLAEITLKLNVVSINNQERLKWIS